jgi:hypothetical protein
VPPPAPQPDPVWRFAVSGDSRNCGDVVMPAIAQSAIANGAQFYLHLGDLRVMSGIDQDILRRREHAGDKTPFGLADYERTAWDDFVQNQIAAWGATPFFVGIGNHEMYGGKDRMQFLLQFADWMNTPAIHDQRLKDDPTDHHMHTYFHFVRGPVDFIYLDNATPDQFDVAQLAWFEGVLARDRMDPTILTVVVGMHAALPESLARGHSMSDTAIGEQSGLRVYNDLLALQTQALKHVYLLASHSHFYMANVFNSAYWRARGGVLPGWIVGTAGAVRYALPPNANQADAAMTNVYGYLMGSVSPDGSIRFDFQQIQETDVPPAVAAQYAPEAIHECYAGNSAAH